MTRNLSTQMNKTRALGVKNDIARNSVEVAGTNKQKADLK